MLEACKLNLGDVAIINHQTIPVSFAELNRQLNPKNILLFGLEPITIKLPFTIPEFKIQEFGACHYLYVPSLDELNQDNDAGKLQKSKLWLCLKQMFNI